MQTRSDLIVIPTAGQLVADSIRRRIVLGELADGDYLPNEAALLELYGVSRPVLREALRILQSESLLSIRRGSKGGARVNAPNVEPVARQAGFLLQYQRTTLADMFRVRAILEPPAVRMLAENVTPEIIAALEEVLRFEEEGSSDTCGLGAAYGDFHTMVVKLCGSSTLAMFAQIVSEITRKHTTSIVSHPHPGDESIDGASLAHKSHQRLVELVIAGKAEEAETHWRAHLDAATDFMLHEDSHEIVDLFS